MELTQQPEQQEAAPKRIRLLHTGYGRVEAAALVAGFAAMFGHGFLQRAQRKARKPLPTMVCSPPEVIAAWNNQVSDASDRLARIRKNKGDRRLLRGLNGNGQAPKFDKPRSRKQHKHELRDAQGAYTLVGRTCIVPDAIVNGVVLSTKVVVAPGRRKWLAGISAQRGY